MESEIQQRHIAYIFAVNRDGDFSVRKPEGFGHLGNEVTFHHARHSVLTNNVSVITLSAVTLTYFVAG